MELLRRRVYNWGAKFRVILLKPQMKIYKAALNLLKGNYA